jgi:SAM-dependent methyltransferase
MLLACWVQSVRANRDHWNRTSGVYQADHDPRIGAQPRLWGCFYLPDAALGGVMGEVTGLRVLELGCGAGQWSRSLAGEAGLLVGFDLSEAQLAAARAGMGPHHYHLVQGAAQQLPFADNVFDLAFCDHGGLSWASPRLAIPEAARVLRPGGRLVFNTASPWLHACYDEPTDRVTDQLRSDYFGQYSIPEEHGATSYTDTYGGWLRTLRMAGLVVDDLIEPRPDPDARSGYYAFTPPDWASRWPTEALWVAHKPT